MENAGFTIKFQFKSALSAFHLEILKSTDNIVLPSDICTPTLERTLHS